MGNDLMKCLEIDVFGVLINLKPSVTASKSCWCGDK